VLFRSPDCGGATVMGKSLLSLSSLEPDRNWIEIDGEKFYMRTQDEISVNDALRMSSLNTKELSDKRIDDILSILIIDLPPEKKAKLLPGHKMKIIATFTTVELKGAAAPTENKISDVSSQGSGGSTVELSKAG
jgi:hypothetical protein